MGQSYKTKQAHTRVRRRKLNIFKRVPNERLYAVDAACVIRWLRVGDGRRRLPADSRRTAPLQSLPSLLRQTVDRDAVDRLYDRRTRTSIFRR